MSTPSDNVRVGKSIRVSAERGRLRHPHNPAPMQQIARKMAHTKDPEKGKTMSETFMHIGKFVVQPENRDTFIEIMKTYEASANQKGLTHSNVIEDEKTEGTFMHVTVWENRDDWVAIEGTEVHKQMHEKRNALLASPMEHDFVCGKVQI